jgi:hypothetical protein
MRPPRPDWMDQAAWDIASHIDEWRIEARREALQHDYPEVYEAVLHGRVEEAIAHAFELPDAVPST